jgi:ubiquitin C-terminal hydrolase
MLIILSDTNSSLIVNRIIPGQKISKKTCQKCSTISTSEEHFGPLIYLSSEYQIQTAVDRFFQ